MQQLGKLNGLSIAEPMMEPFGEVLDFALALTTVPAHESARVRRSGDVVDVLFHVECGLELRCGFQEFGDDGPS